MQADKMPNTMPNKMPNKTLNKIKEILARIPDSAGGSAADIMDDARLISGKLQVILLTEPKHAQTREPMRQQAEQALQQDFPSARVILAAHKSAPRPSSPAFEKIPLPARAIIAVASGKGGVGKSMAAANLAAALAAQGVSTGLLDADIYGPSQPQMLGIHEKPGVSADKKLLPVSAHGVKLLSLGMMMPPERAVVWRGLMVQSALTQMLRDADWSGVDILVLDLPPGTGDAQLTLAQKLTLNGAVLISTPQEIALADVRRALAMLRRMDVPLLGLIENMAFLELPDGERSYVFGEGGAKRLAEKEQVPFLGEIPLDAEIGRSCESGTPLVLSQPESAGAKVFTAIAALLSEQLLNK